MKDNIYLIGGMGSGKTTLGRRLASLLNKTFYDSDEEIERLTGVDIPWIFDLEGETGFRLRETKILTELCQLKNIVLATGGGAVLSPLNRQLLSRHGWVVFLNIPIEEQIKRLAKDKRRPLLQRPDKQTHLIHLMADRMAHYQAIADYTLDIQSTHFSACLEELLSAYQQKTL